MYNLYPLVPWLAMFLDMILGDPRTRWHPVVLIGHIISFWERCLYPKNTKPMHAILKGACCVLFVLLTVGGIGGVIIFLATWTSYYVYWVTAAIVLYITITPNSLARDGKEIAHLLMIKNLPLARQKLSWIVGRDTNNLDEGEIARATIETVAENITDGILSPLFYFSLFGPMGALLYRASNTMDSMLGYKNQRYLFFGRVAARLDDVLNYIPARITAALILLAAWLWKLNWRHAWLTMTRDAVKHPSPNGGYAEATVAGALNIRLGGYNYYEGTPEFREYMGDALHPITCIDILLTIRLMYTATWLMIGIVSLMALIG